MTTTLLFVATAILLLITFATFALRRSRELPEPGPAVTAIQSLDIEAFRNLVDPAEEAYLRRNLPPNEFKKIKRERIKAAFAYVHALSKASLDLARFGGEAQQSSDAALVASGRQIANSAIHLRLRVMDANLRLTLAVVFPAFDPRPLHSLVSQYDRAKHLVQSHNGLKRARMVAS